MAMLSSAKLSYQRLKNEIWLDEEEDYSDIRDKINGRYYFRKIRFRRVRVKRKLRVKIPSLKRFLTRKARLFKVALTKVYKRLKEGQSHFGDLFAGNYLFMQVTPTPLKCTQNGSISFVKGNDGNFHGFSVPGVAS